MKNTRKPLTTLTLGQKNLSRREVFMAEQDAVKALKAKNLGRPISQRMVIMAKADAVKALKAMKFSTACPEKVGEKSLYMKRTDRDKALKAKGLEESDPILDAMLRIGRRS